MKPPTKTRPPAPLRSFALFAVLVSACSSTGVGNPSIDDLTTQEQALYDDGDDGRKAGDAASALVSIPLVALREADLASGDSAANVAALGARFTFTPQSCVTATRAGATVTYAFSGCTYNFGLAEVNGTLTATYTTAATGMDVAIASKDLTIGAFDRAFRPITVDASIGATASIRFEGGRRQIDWSGTYTATAGALTVTHEASYSADFYDVNCVLLAGSSITKFPNGKGVEAVLTDYRRCGAKTACPLEGGTLTFTAWPARDVSLGVRFLGVQRLLVTPPNRKAFENDTILKCTG